MWAVSEEEPGLPGMNLTVVRVARERTCLPREVVSGHR